MQGRVNEIEFACVWRSAINYYLYVQMCVWNEEKLHWKVTQQQQREQATIKMQKQTIIICKASKKTRCRRKEDSLNRAMAYTHE